MVNFQYKRSCTEVLEILKNIPKEDYERIPKKIIKVLENDKDENYLFTYDPNKTLDEQSVLKETKVMIAVFFRDYWANEHQKEIILNNENMFRNELMQQKNEVFKYDNLFKKQNKEDKNDDNLEVKMKTVVITGSARGLGFNMARFFREYNYNVILSDLKEENLIKAKIELEQIKSEGKIAYKVCNVSSLEELNDLMSFAIEEFKEVDIWINNAGVNQPQKPVWELSKEEINTLIDVDLKGTIYGSKVAMEEMIKQR